MGLTCACTDKADNQKTDSKDYFKEGGQGNDLVMVR